MDNNIVFLNYISKLHIKSKKFCLRRTQKKILKKNLLLSSLFLIRYLYFSFLFMYEVNNFYKKI